MHSNPEIAIVEQNTLSALGMRTILEEMLPTAVVRVFFSFQELVNDTPDMYAHYFVSSQIYFEHTAFFLERRPKTIVLSVGELTAPVPVLNICASQDELVQAVMMLRSKGHHVMPHSMHGGGQEIERELSPREIEVLILVTKGLINKEIADKLNISLTTVISHRKNITEKLGIKSVSGLAIYAVMHGYIEVDSI